MFQGKTLIPNLPASDMERAQAWYLEKLGLKPVDDGDGGAARYEAGHSWFMLYPSAFAGTNKATAAAWEVDDIDGVVTELKSRGVEFQEFELEGMTMENSILSSPTGNRIAWFNDSEGNILAVAQM